MENGKRVSVSPWISTAYAGSLVYIQYFHAILNKYNWTSVAIITDKDSPYVYRSVADDIAKANIRENRRQIFRFIESNNGVQWETLLQELARHSRGSSDERKSQHVKCVFMDNRVHYSGSMPNLFVSVFLFFGRAHTLRQLLVCFYDHVFNIMIAWIRSPRSSIQVHGRKSGVNALP